MKNNKTNKGQAAILIIFVIGMVGLLIGMSLTKTGFGESLMGRGAVDSTNAFYVANSGIEDAFYKIQELDYGYPSPGTYILQVGDGEAKITVSGTRDERVIESVGKYDRFVRKIRVATYNTEIRPGFPRAIQGGAGGIELENRIEITGRDKFTGNWYPGDIYSNTYIKGVNNGSNGDCSSPASTTRINGSAWAVTNIERMGSGDGPCIDVDAYAGSIKECQILGSAYSGTPISNIDCPYNSLCDPIVDPVKCKVPEILPLPDIGLNPLKQHLQVYGSIYSGDCVIGGANDCTTLRSDGLRSIGNLIIEGDLDITSDFYVSGPIWVKGDVNISSNLTVSLVPEITDTSLLILANGKVNSSSNVTFTSDAYSFLLFASEYANPQPNVCQDEDEAAVKISANVSSILFYAINGCSLVENPTASSEFYGAILGEGIKVKNNSRIVYDPALQNAEFVLSQEGGWQISSFTEI